MNKAKLAVQMLVAGMCCLANGARAGIVYYTIANTGGAGTQSGYSDLDTVNIKIDGTTVNGALTGGIQIKESGGPVAGLPTKYTTVCTDINGALYLGNTYAYQTPVTPFGTQTGVDPTWGALNGPGIEVHNTANATQAIQNAAYLFYHYVGGITKTGIGGTADQMAGLQLAVWEALYDTTSSGKVVANEGTATTSSTARFQVTGGDTAAMYDANSYLAILNSQLNIGNFGYAGYLLFPDPADNSNGGNLNKYGNAEPPQELLIAVPEPSTILAGAMLLLPFGASTLQILRKRLTA